MARRSQLRLSKSSVGMYLECPKSYWFSHIQKLPSKPDYSRLTGSEVHKFIAKMHSSNNYPLYYKTLDSARGAWFWAWQKAIEEAGPYMLSRTKKQDDEYGKIGWFCIANYWKQNISKPQPWFVEKRFEYQLFPMVNFIGIMDQLRKMPVEKIQQIRPELVVDGKLSDEYDPVVIVDCKTGRSSYDLRKFDPDAESLRVASFQFELHEDLQVTAYYWLYYQHFKKLPVGFYWYHLRDGKAFLTYRTKGDFTTFIETMRHAVDGMKAESYPKHVGTHCNRCDYFEACAALREDRPLMTTEPSDGVDYGGEVHTYPILLPPRYRQLRFKFPPKRLEKRNG